MGRAFRRLFHQPSGLDLTGIVIHSITTSEGGTLETQRFHSPTLILLVIVLLLATLPEFSFSQGLLAHYPLNSNPYDTTAMQDSMTLTRTPYQEGGIYCNGINIFSGDTTACNAVTPHINPFNFGTFSISTRFKVTEFATTFFRPVFIAGMSYRWIGFVLFPNGTVGMKYNNSTIVNSTMQYTLNTWHEATVTYDSTSGFGKFYLDGVLAGSAQFQLVHINDRQVGVTDNSFAFTFKGILNNLKVYNTVIVPPTSVGGGTTAIPEQLELSQNYPNPFNPRTTIRFSIPRSEFTALKIFNLLGQEVSTLVSEKLSAGTHRFEWSPQGMPSGVYFYRLQAGDFAETKKLLLLK